MAWLVVADTDSGRLYVSTLSAEGEYVTSERSRAFRFQSLSEARRVAAKVKEYRVVRLRPRVPAPFAECARLRGEVEALRRDLDVAEDVNNDIRCIRNAALEEAAMMVEAHEGSLFPPLAERVRGLKR